MAAREPASSPTSFARFIAGDARAFDDVLRAYWAPALTVALRVLRDRELAEEAVQDAFVRIWQQGHRFDAGRGSERTWILSVVRNQAIDTLRKRLRLREQTLDEWLESEPETADEGWETVVRGANLALIREAMRELPEEQRGAINLAYFRDMRPVEIARSLGIPEGTVRSRLRIGLARLRRALEPLRDDLARSAP